MRKGQKYFDSYLGETVEIVFPGLGVVVIEDRFGDRYFFQKDHVKFELIRQHKN